MFNDSCLSYLSQSTEVPNFDEAELAPKPKKLDLATSAMVGLASNKLKTEAAMVAAEKAHGKGGGKATNAHGGVTVRDGRTGEERPAKKHCV